MSDNDSQYYVYLYIDPRNFEEFYYGKGKGARKYAHLGDQDNSKKSQRIKAIEDEGGEPIIKVIATDLTEHEALLVETTLLWKHGKGLTNHNKGDFINKFRPHNTLHLNLEYFDYKNGLYYVNVGEGDHRCWEDCKRFGFLSAGQDKRYSDPIRTLEKGDIVVAYLVGYGYVGVGRVQEKAVPVNDFKIDNKPLDHYNLAVPNIYENCDNEKSEYPVKIEWIETVNKEDAKWQPNSGLFTNQNIKASLQNQPDTVRYLEEQFNVNFSELMNEE